MTSLRLKAKVGPKGQAVIPKPVRDALGVQPGDEIYFSLHEGHAHVERRPPGEILREYFDSLPDRTGTGAMSGAELKRLREEAYEDRCGATSP